jgi:poly-gamma-glutamate capsule biosynthesis protein CapA/YwtB (metallophosphatase superfamily)
MNAVLGNIIVAGDLVLDEPDASYWLSGIAPVLQSADLAIGHLEVPHTLRGSELPGDVPAPGAPPENSPAIVEAGIGLVSLAGNHMADCGPEGIADTIASLKSAGIAYAGAGPDLASARAPARTVVNGLRIAFLSYNCVGPENSWASADAAGCAYLPIGTADGSVVTPRAPLDHVLPEAFEILRADIAAARDDADLVLVAMHKGIVHTPAKLAPYERAIAQAAVEAGADAVLGHHSHIARGIEFYRGKPIFHGLGNACVVTRALSPAQDHPGRRDWAERRKKMFGFEPDPAYHLAPFHPEAVNAFLGRLTVLENGDLETSVIPIFVEAPGRPVLADPEQAEQIRRYLERITLEAGLPAISIENNGRVRESHSS